MLPEAAGPCPVQVAHAVGHWLKGFAGAGLGDATWSVSSGIGTCAAAGLYEVGRPDRLSGQEAETLEAQWQDFGKQNPYACVFMHYQSVS